MVKDERGNYVGRGPNCVWSDITWSKSLRTKAFSCPKGPKGKGKKTTRAFEVKGKKKKKK